MRIKWNKGEKCMKKRMIGALLALCMIVGLLPSLGAFALDDDAKPQLIVSTETAKPGDDVTVNISTANNPGFGVITMPIHYDKDKLEYIGFENAGLTSWTVVTSAVWVGDEDSHFNGVILKLKFKVLDSAEEGLASVSVECRPGDVYNYAEEPIMFDVVSGGVEVQRVHHYTAAVTEPTCTEKGYTTHTCRCGDSYVDDYVDALGHDFGEWTVTKAATCTEAGEETRAVSALGHKWDDGVVTTEPTEAATGVKTFTCTVCGEIKTETIPMLEHTHNYAAVAKQPTCTEKGYTTYTCRCGDSYVDDYVDALGHDFGAWTVTKPATCTQEGEHTRACSRCDAVETEAIPALGHDFGAWTVTKEATCTEEGERTRACSRCDVAETEAIPALGHKWDDGVVTTEPTATKDGVKTFTCTVCGETKTEAIPATGVCDGGESCPSRSFSDVQAHWGHLSIDYCVKNGLMNGMGNGKFDPEGTLTRAMLATILWRQAGEPKATKDCTFTDLGSSSDPAASWYLDAVAWAAEVGVVNGYPDGTFAPSGAITRQEMATMLYRYAGIMKFDTSAKGDLSVFPDENQVLDYAVDAMIWANGAELITGDVVNDVTCLNPLGNATRAQVATILMRFCENVAK